MPTFVYMTRCDGCGHCVDICPSDIMHIDKTIRRAVNIEPNMCWECYSCVKACPQNAIDARGYTDFAPQPWGEKIPKLGDLEVPDQAALDSQLLCFEPDALNVEKGLPVISKDKLKEGVYY